MPEQSNQREFIQFLKGQTNLLQRVALLPMTLSSPSRDNQFEDMKASDLLDLYFGISETGIQFHAECREQNIKPVAALSQRIGLSPITIQRNAQINNEVLRRLVKPDMPQLLLESYNSRVEGRLKFLADAELVNLAIESNDPYCNSLMKVPIFSDSPLPDLVAKIGEQICNGEQVNYDDLPNVGKILRTYFGIGNTPRMDAEQINNLIGFAPGNSDPITQRIQASLLLLRRNFFNDDIQTQVNPRVFEVITGIESMVTRLIQYGSNFVNSPYNPLTMVSTMANKLFLAGFAPRNISSFMQRYLLNPGVAEKLDTRTLYYLSRLEQNNRTYREGISSLDEREYASWLLDRNRYVGGNPRIQLAANILQEIYGDPDFRPTVEELCEEYNLSDDQLFAVIKGVREELAFENHTQQDDPNSLLLQQKYREQYFEKLRDMEIFLHKDVGRYNARKVNKELHPIYAAYREELGAEGLSLLDKEILRGIAAGETSHEIATRLNLDPIVISTSAFILINGAEEITKGREVRRRIFHQAHEVISSNRGNTKIESQATLEELETITQVLLLRSLGHSVATIHEQLLLSKTDIVRYSKIGLALVNNFIKGSEPIWDKGRNMN